MYEYRAKILKVIDGDTVDVDEGVSGSKVCWLSRLASGEGVSSAGCVMGVSGVLRLFSFSARIDVTGGD